MMLVRVVVAHCGFKVGMPHQALDKACGHVLAEHVCVAVRAQMMRRGLHDALQIDGRQLKVLNCRRCCRRHPQHSFVDGVVAEWGMPPPTPQARPQRLLWVASRVPDELVFC